MYSLNPKYKSIEDILDPKGIKIDLGCGYYKPRGFIGIDNGVGYGSQIANDDNSPDIIMNIDQEDLPLPDKSCVIVRASHFLEHSCNVEHVITEAHRVLKKGGRLILILPYANSAEGMYPGHSIFFTERWFYENMTFQKLFAITREKYKRSKEWRRLPFFIRWLIPFRFARVFLYNACNQMELHAVKKSID